MARAIECIIVNMFFIITAQYVDDYPQFEMEAIADDKEDTMVEVLKLLGWDIKKPDGSPPKFGTTFPLLGVHMHLEGHCEGTHASGEPAGEG